MSVLKEPLSDFLVCAVKHLATQWRSWFSVAGGPLQGLSLGTSGDQEFSFGGYDAGVSGTEITSVPQCVVGLGTKSPRN